MNLEQNYLCKVLDEKQVSRFMVLCLRCRNAWRTGYKRVGTTSLACAQCGAAGDGITIPPDQETSANLRVES